MAGNCGAGPPVFLGPAKDSCRALCIVRAVYLYIGRAAEEERRHTTIRTCTCTKQSIACVATAHVWLASASPQTQAFSKHACAVLKGPVVSLDKRMPSRTEAADVSVFVGGGNCDRSCHAAAAPQFSQHNHGNHPQRREDKMELTTKQRKKRAFRNAAFLPIPPFLGYILNTPHVLSLSTPWFCPPHAICNPMPSTRRVCSGGMMPSSHSLADPNVASLSCSIRALSAGSTFLPTASMTDESCSAPMTDVLAFGQVNMSRGEYARPLQAAHQ